MLAILSPNCIFKINDEIIDDICINMNIKDFLYAYNVFIEGGF